MNAWFAGDSHMRAALTEIANWVDRELATDADVKGDPRPGTPARVIEASISNSSARVSVTYQVFPDDRLVRVTMFVFRSV